MAETIVSNEQIESIKKKAKEKDESWKGMHRGTVAGKSFEASRRSRKSHSARRAQIASKK